MTYWHPPQHTATHPAGSFNQGGGDPYETRFHQAVLQAFAHDQAAVVEAALHYIEKSYGRYIAAEQEAGAAAGKAYPAAGGQVRDIEGLIVARAPRRLTQVQGEEKETDGNAEPSRAVKVRPERLLQVDGDVEVCPEIRRPDIANGDPSPLVRIAIALEGVREECRRIADCVEVCRPPTKSAVLSSDTKRPEPCEPRSRQVQEGLTVEVSLAARDHLQMRSQSRSPYLGANDAAEYLGITVSSLYAVVERGYLTPLRGPRRTYRFTREMLDDYLKRRKWKAKR